MEGNNHIIYLLLLYLRLQNVHPMPAENVSFDRLIFAQNWPRAICEQWLDGGSSHTCSPRNTWTVHGIWPSKIGIKKGPLFCRKHRPFRPEQVESIAVELNAVWPEMLGDPSRSKYWLYSHEWNKHGKCAASLGSLDTELKYFSQGITWIKQYNMFEVLKEAGITPSGVKTYTIEDINEVIFQKLQVKAIIKCFKEDGKDLLQDIRLCFDNTLQLVDCDGMYRGHGGLMTNCESNEIYYA